MVNFVMFLKLFSGVETLLMIKYSSIYLFCVSNYGFCPFISVTVEWCSKSVLHRYTHS